VFLSTYKVSASFKQEEKCPTFYGFPSTFEVCAQDQKVLASAFRASSYSRDGEGGSAGCCWGVSRWSEGSAGDTRPRDH